MFKDRDEEVYNQREEDTVIGGSIKIEGDLASEGNIVIEGHVIGSVKTQGHLTIGHQAKVEAEVNAGETIISGEVNGNIVVSGKTELTQSAKINGDINTQKLKVEEGAAINGKIQMDEGTVSVKSKAKKENKEKKQSEEKPAEVAPETESQELDF